MDIPKFGSKEEEKDFYKTRIESFGLPMALSNILLSKNIRTIGGLVGRSNRELKREFNISKDEVIIIEHRIKIFFSKQELLNKIRTLDKPTPQPKPIILSIAGENDLVAFFASKMGVSKDDVEGSSRRGEVVRVRDTIAFLFREYGGLSFPSIGKLLGGRDHTTIMHSYRKVRATVQKDQDLEHSLNELVSKAKDLKKYRDNIESVLLDVNVFESYKAGKVIQFKEVPERESGILELYRKGTTLENIGKSVGVTRERVRQLIKKTLKQISINESISNGSSVTDIDILFEQEKRKRKDLKPPTKSFRQKVYKEKSWSRHYIACKSCGTISVPHFRNGLCENCGNKSISGNARENMITEHQDKCDNCAISRNEARLKYGRDFYLSRSNKSVLCKQCHLITTGEKLGKFRKNKWKMFYK